MERRKLNLDWRVGHMPARDGTPKKFVPAAVPGAVQVDWAKAEGMPDWNWELNFKEYGWMEDCFWVYRAEIPKTALGGGERLVLRCGGVDYKYAVLFDGKPVYAYEGMFRPFELDLSDAAAKGGELSVVIEPVPKAPGARPNTRAEAAQSCKPPVSYGWDWHPRLIPSGIWDETTLTVEPAIRLLGAEVAYTLSADCGSAVVTVEAELAGMTASDAAAGKDGAELRFRLTAPDGATVLDTRDVFGAHTVEKPALWWCNGYGEPNLYLWELTLAKADAVISQKAGRVGFKRVSLEMNPGTWAEPDGFPKTRSRAPITLTLNGIPIFAKGSNWVNPEMFPGVMTRGTYEPLLRRAREANMNLLRIWGGGIVNKESFFELCDEYGLMVWQEFPLACNKYPDTPEYLAVLESEATAIIRRLRGHASLAIWCGGNELFNNWSGMTDQALPLRLLNKLCYEHGRGLPFLPTSPVDGMAHGCYLFVYPDGRETYQAMAESHFTAYTEFGVPSVSNLETCFAMSTRDRLFPLVKNEMTVAHHAFDAWSAEDSWCGIETLRAYFGEPESLERIIEWSQWLQCEGYKSIYEEARRQKPYCSMALNWCYNEPWPTLANNSLLNYPATPKPAFFAVAKSCRNRLASARIPRFGWRPGDRFETDIWLLNDGTLPIPAGRVDVYLSYAGERKLLLGWEHPEVPANGNLAGPTARHIITPPAEWDAAARGISAGAARRDMRGRRIPTELVLTLEAGEMSSEYRLLLYC